MLLVCTNDSQQRDNQQSMLLLGEWCKSFEDNQFWNSSEYEIIPYHWNDREKMLRDFDYLNSTFDCYIELLTQILNEVHSEQNSTRYWRIILGPWLLFFLHSLFDRYECLKRACESNHDLITFLPEGCFVPGSLKEFIHHVQGNHYNALLCRQVIEYGNLEIKINKLGTPEAETRVEKQLLNPVEIFKIASHYLAKPFNDIVIQRSNSNLSYHDFVLLHLKLGLWPAVYPEFHGSNTHLKHSFREQNLGLKSQDPFFQLIDSCLAANLPPYILESYQSTKRAALSLFPTNCKFIFYNNHNGDEGVRFFAANAVNNGSKLISVQHGGFANTARYSSGLRLEESISDYYLTWGENIKQGNYYRFL